MSVPAASMVMAGTVDMNEKVNGFVFAVGENAVLRKNDGKGRKPENVEACESFRKDKDSRWGFSEPWPWRGCGRKAEKLGAFYEPMTRRRRRW